MMKMLVGLVIGLAVGAVGGMQYGIRHPDQAADISNKADVKELQTQIAVTKAEKAVYDQFADRPNADPATVAKRDALANKINDLQAQLDAKK